MRILLSILLSIVPVPPVAATDLWNGAESGMSLTQTRSHIRKIGISVERPISLLKDELIQTAPFNLDGLKFYANFYLKDEKLTAVGLYSTGPATETQCEDAFEKITIRIDKETSLSWENHGAKTQFNEIRYWNDSRHNIALVLDRKTQFIENCALSVIYVEPPSYDKS